jgi:hypothetical protein
VERRSHERRVIYLYAGLALSLPHQRRSLLSVLSFGTWTSLLTSKLQHSKVGISYSFAMPSRDTSELEGANLERLTAIQDNVRSMLREVDTPAASSVYSGTPNPGIASVARNQTPRTPARSLFGRLRFPFEARTPQSQQDNLPGRPFEYSPASEPSEWSRLPDEPEPAHQSPLRHPADIAPIVYEDRDLEAALPVQRSKKRKNKKRRRRQRHDVWTRRHGKKQSGTCLPLLHGHTRIKSVTCIISGLFLASVLTICM